MRSENTSGVHLGGRSSWETVSKIEAVSKIEVNGQEQISLYQYRSIEQRTSSARHAWCFSQCAI